MEGVLHRPEKSDILNPENISNFLGKGENGMEHRGHRPGQRHEISDYADVPAKMTKTR